jgi:hypothetical protein
VSSKKLYLIHPDCGLKEELTQVTTDSFIYSKGRIRFDATFTEIFYVDSENEISWMIGGWILPNHTNGNQNNRKNNGKFNFKLNFFS